MREVRAEAEIEYPDDDILIDIGKTVVRMLLESQPVYVGRRGITIDGDAPAPQSVKTAIRHLNEQPTLKITTPWDDDDD